MGKLQLLLACVTIVPLCSGKVPTTSHCLPYVDEGSQLHCTCRPPAGVTQATLTWPGHSDTSQLVIGNVRRQDNGTQYVCQMVVNGQTTTTTYTLRVAYGPSDATMEITGQSPFPTDGSRNLTLVCEDRDVYPTPSYSWKSGMCDNDNTGSICTFTPDVRYDDGKKVTCRALNTGGTANRVGSKTFTVLLQYPPRGPPAMSGFQSGQILKSGDKINCTVNGGKPLVTSVTFICRKPLHVGSQDGVTSTITIDTSQASEDNMTCSCTANWEPEFALYTLRADVSIPLEYKAKVTKFTINDTTGSLTVNEWDNVTVIFTCNARGRPAPILTILNSTRGELQFDAGNETIEGFDRNVSYTLQRARMENMGTYYCIVDNNFTFPTTASVQLNVRSAPKGAFLTTKENPEELKKEGLTFTVLAYPKPDTFVFTFYGNKLNPTLSSVPSGTFNVTSIVEDPSLSVVICSIKPLDVPHDRLGVYRVEVSNGLEGTYKYFFQVRHASTDVSKETSVVAATVGSVVGGISVLTAATVVGILIWKKRVCVKDPRYEKPKPRRDGDSNPYTGLQPQSNYTRRQHEMENVNPEPQASAFDPHSPQSSANALSVENGYNLVQIDTDVIVERKPDSSGPGSTDSDGYEVPGVILQR